MMMLEMTFVVNSQDEFDQLYPQIKALLPLAQVKTTPAEPVATQPAPAVPQQAPPQAAPAASQAAPAPQIAMETVRARLTDLSRSGKNEQVKGIIAHLGYSKFTEVPPERYGELMALAEGL